MEATMNDNNARIPEPTLTRVLLDNPYELRRWCQRFVCTEQQLRDAVAKVGDGPDDVRRQLDRNR